MLFYIKNSIQSPIEFKRACVARTWLLTLMLSLRGFVLRKTTLKTPFVYILTSASGQSGDLKSIVGCKARQLIDRLVIVGTVGTVLADTIRAESSCGFPDGIRKIR